MFAVRRSPSRQTAVAWPPVSPRPLGFHLRPNHTQFPGVPLPRPFLVPPQGNSHLPLCLQPEPSPKGVPPTRYPAASQIGPGVPPITPSGQEGSSRHTQPSSRAATCCQRPVCQVHPSTPFCPSAGTRMPHPTRGQPPWQGPHHPQQRSSNSWSPGTRGSNKALQETPIRVVPPLNARRTHSNNPSSPWRP